MALLLTKSRTVVNKSRVDLFISCGLIAMVVGVKYSLHLF